MLSDPSFTYGVFFLHEYSITVPTLRFIPLGFDVECFGTGGQFASVIRHYIELNNS